MQRHTDATSPELELKGASLPPPNDPIVGLGMEDFSPDEPLETTMSVVDKKNGTAASARALVILPHLDNIDVNKTWIGISIEDFKPVFISNFSGESRMKSQQLRRGLIDVIRSTGIEGLSFERPSEKFPAADVYVSSGISGETPAQFGRRIIEQLAKLYSQGTPLLKSDLEFGSAILPDKATYAATNEPTSRPVIVRAFNGVVSNYFKDSPEIHQAIEDFLNDNASQDCNNFLTYRSALIFYLDQSSLDRDDIDAAITKLLHVGDSLENQWSLLACSPDRQLVKTP